MESLPRTHGPNDERQSGTLCEVACPKVGLPDGAMPGWVHIAQW
jgi:hypothetical protein